ncbi:hypothetical protein ACVBEF_03420 [Glaciimonas sp. GG7]
MFPISPHTGSTSIALNVVEAVGVQRAGGSRPDVKGFSRFACSAPTSVAAISPSFIFPDGEPGKKFDDVRSNVHWRLYVSFKQNEFKVGEMLLLVDELLPTLTGGENMVPSIVFLFVN